jgi:starvation-inducible DNA-binding protein
MPADALKQKPKSETVKSGIADRKAVAKALAPALADTYVLLIKTHAYHWNVVGPEFYSIHKLTEEQYEDMFEAADELAERIRALGELAPMNFAAMSELAKLDEAKSAGSAREMVEDLASDHERLSMRLHAVIRVSEDQNDYVTADLATQRSAFHEQAVWMLRAILAE